MYADTESAHFLDGADFNQYSLSREEVAGELQYITEDLQGMLALIYNGQCVGIQLPTAVDLKITQCDPAVKGNSATSRTKPATARDRPDGECARILERRRYDSGRHTNGRFFVARVTQIRVAHRKGASVISTR